MSENNNNGHLIPLSRIVILWILSIAWQIRDSCSRQGSTQLVWTTSRLFVQQAGHFFYSPISKQAERDGILINENYFLSVFDDASGEGLESCLGSDFGSCFESGFVSALESGFESDVELVLEEELDFL